MMKKLEGADLKQIEALLPLLKEGTDKAKEWPFTFNRTFDPKANQQVIFDEISGLVQSALDGFNVCVFAYGQTGAGKTYTMEGPNALDMDDWTKGVIPRAVVVQKVHTRARPRAFPFEDVDVLGGTVLTRHEFQNPTAPPRGVIRPDHHNRNHGRLSRPSRDRVNISCVHTSQATRLARHSRRGSSGRCARDCPVPGRPA